MTIHGVLGAILIGLVIGALGRLIVPGRQKLPIWLTVLVGIGAALGGTALVGSFRDTNGIDWVELLVQLGLAAFGVTAVSALFGNRRRHIF